ncbi:hypothetical protein Tco_1014810 [Tanacetum coccineum]
MELVLEQTQQVDIEKVAVRSSLRSLKPKRTIESRAKRSSINLIRTLFHITCSSHNVKTRVIIRVLRIILVVLPEHPSDTYVFTMKMEILLEPTSNKLMVDVPIKRTCKLGDSDVHTLEDPTLILEILSRRFFLRLNLPDHRFKCPVHIHNHKDHLGKFDDGFFIGYSQVAKAFRDPVSFKEPPELIVANDHPALVERDQLESANNLKPAKIQDSFIMEPINDVQLTLILSPLAEGILQPPVPQDRWSREKHIELVNIIGELLASITTRSRLIEALEEKGWIISMQEELNQFERNKTESHQDLSCLCSLHGFYGASDGCEKCIFEWEDLIGDVVQRHDWVTDVSQLADLISNSPHVSVLGSGFNLKAYSDSDYARCNLDRKSTSGGCQILGGKLVFWSAKKQSSIAMSSAKAEYVVAAGCCAQVL